MNCVTHNSDLGTTKDWLLPQHSHSYSRATSTSSSQYGGAGQGKISLGNSSTTGKYPTDGDVHAGSTVRPPSYCVNFWKRVS